MTVTDNIKKVEDAWKILEDVYDPEVPVLSVIDLGIIRHIKMIDDTLEVTITPTYTGCPAMDVISMNIKFALLQNGYTKLNIKSILSPAWTTAWMSETGKQKLKAYGIAPPQYTKALAGTGLFEKEENVPCPLCNSSHTKLVSQFGSTACKALYQCEDCKEPFDYFKCH